jgi:hypothetical protein
MVFMWVYDTPAHGFSCDYVLDKQDWRGDER